MLFNHQDNESRLIVEDSLNIIPAINYATLLIYNIFCQSISLQLTINLDLVRHTNKVYIYIFLIGTLFYMAKSLEQLYNFIAKKIAC